MAFEVTYDPIEGDAVMNTMNTNVIFQNPYERAGVVTPGLPILPHGVERHPIPGGGSRAVRISQGDEITVQDREGLQPVEMVFFAPDGTSDAGMIGAKGGRDPEGLKTALMGDKSGAKVLRALAAAGFDIGRADGILIFGDESRAGDRETFTATSDGLLIVCAPGGPMNAHEQWAPTEIALYVRRANPGNEKGKLLAPEPLADPLVDMNILPGEAKAYEVRKGQYIQVLDV